MKKFVRTRAGPGSAAAVPPPAGRSSPESAGGARRDGLRGATSSCRREVTASPGCVLPSSVAPLWEDPEPAPRLPERHRAAHPIVWLRPHELCAQPRFLGDVELEAGLPPDLAPPEPEDRFAARWRLEVGALGSPALCVAAAALAPTPRLLARVVPPHSFRAGYTGRFGFKFWMFGEWREVSVDDRLPTCGGRLLASRAALQDDFTMALLEKAYAKVHGAYGAPAAADGPAQALRELSGGVVQSFSPPRQPRALLLRVLHSALPRCTLLIATTAQEKETPGRRLRDGLVAGQAYCVAGLARGRCPAGTLVRLRVPAGRGEWTGYRKLAELERRAAPPGHFWMPFEDFANAFGRLELVHLGPEEWLREPALHDRPAWRAAVARRRWLPGYNAGGPPDAPTASANPQFEGIGFAVYELPASGSASTSSAAGAPLARPRPDVTHCCAAHEVATFFTVPAGRYLVVPHTRRAHTAAAFLLRILTDRHADVWEVNEDNALVRDVAAEFEREPWPLPVDVQAIADKLLRKPDTQEVDAETLLALLRGAARRLTPARASPELSRSLLALRDPSLAGRVPASRLPALLALLATWKRAVEALASRGGAFCARRVSAYRLRALLCACGLSVSNKVLECLVLRYAREAALTPHACLLALARLHLAHDRYRRLDAKLKSNPLSLEEMISMTIYS